MSATPSSPQRSFQFGLFELDSSAGELRKQGRRVKLQDQPLQVLEQLLRRPGALVTREELQKALWPADTFVEFDQGLNTAIKKIRLALGDSADNPRFVETVPRKGYRFIAPVDSPVPLAKKLGTSPIWPVVLFIVAIDIGLGFWLLHPAQTLETTPSPVPLTSYPGDEVSPTFSPDGNHVAFAWNSSETMRQGSFDIFVKLIGGGDPVRLTHDAADEFSPAWSPDGRYIAFLRTLSPATSGVFVIPAIGGAERKLAEIYQNDPNRGYYSYICWWPDSGWLVVPNKASPRAPSALFRLSVETGETQRLTSPPQESSGDWDPAVSPDGRALAFRRSIAENAGDLYLLEIGKTIPSGTTPTPLTSGAESPVWVPDGRAIVFCSGNTHTPSLWKLTLTSPGWRPGERERLTFAGEGIQSPAISRRGRLAYGQIAINVDIWRIAFGNSHLTANPPSRFISSTRVDHEPRYSPDGKRIAFGSNRSGSSEIWVCNHDGSNATQLTDFRATQEAAGARWSPDGKFLSFIGKHGATQKAYVINSAGGKPKLLIEDLADWSLSEWSRDARWIYFGSSRSGEKQLWKIPWPQAGSAVQVTKHGFLRDAIESADGKFVYYLKGAGEGENSLWRVPAAGGEESPLLPSIYNNNFTLASQGIYFIPSSRPYALQFASFGGGKVVTAAEIPREPAWGLSVSPDGKSLLYTEFEAIRSDLMLVENFR